MASGSARSENRAGSTTAGRGRFQWVLGRVRHRLDLGVDRLEEGLEPRKLARLEEFTDGGSEGEDGDLARCLAPRHVPRASGRHRSRRHCRVRLVLRGAAATEHGASHGEGIETVEIGAGRLDARRDQDQANGGG